MEPLGPTLHHHHFFTSFTFILSLSKYTRLSLSTTSRFILPQFHSPEHHHHHQFTTAAAAVVVMAQKREKEETELKVPETLTLCTPSITSATSKITASDDLRSSSPDRSDLKTGAVVDSRSSSGSSPIRPDLNQKIRSRSRPRSPPATAETAETTEDDLNKLKRRVINRCSGCRRKVGLMGFRCRCGEMFCSDHRYSDRHDCSYDYKAAGREAIARENPVVRAAKILKV